MIDHVWLHLEVKIPNASARAFLAAHTGKDDDVILAAEKAIRGRLADEYNEGEQHPHEDVEISGLVAPDRDDLMDAASREARERVAYGPYAAR